MASGWNLSVWIQCIGVVGCCYKEVYRYQARRLVELREGSFTPKVDLLLNTLPLSYVYCT